MYTGDQKPGVGNGPVTPDRHSMDRIGKAAQYVEKFYRGGAPLPRNGPHGDDKTFAIFRITAASIAPFPGTGAGVLQAQTTPLGLIDSTEPEAAQTLVNFTDKTITGGTATSRAICAWILGRWWIVVPYSCSMLP
jgi:hypothetical protein